MPNSRHPSAIEFQIEAKRSLLLSRLTLLISGLAVLYFFIGLRLGVSLKTYIFIPFIASSLLTYFLNARGWLMTAKIIGLLSVNTMIYLVSSSEPFETGMHLHFASACAVAIVLFGYEDWTKAVLFVSISAVLYLLVFLTDISFLPMRAFYEGQARIFFIINLCVTTVISTYSLLYFLRLYYITEQELRKKESLLVRKNLELEKTNGELDRFIYSASHDLRAPLSSISGLVGLIRKEPELSAKEEYLDMIEGRVTRLEHFIRDIIGFSRNLRTDVMIEAVRLHPLVNEIMETLRFIPAAQTIEFRNDLPQDFSLMTDRARINIILFNLISNAIQYSDDQKKSSQIRISERTEGSGIQLKLEDNGIGIEPAHLSKVFDMFYRASAQSKGSGLGLYMVKETMQKLGGKVSIVSELNEGTTVTLEWPV